MIRDLGGNSAISKHVALLALFQQGSLAVPPAGSGSQGEGSHTAWEVNQTSSLLASQPTVLPAELIILQSEQQREIQSLGLNSFLSPR